MENKLSIKKLTLQGISLLLYFNALNIFVMFLALYFSAFFVFSSSNFLLQNFRDLRLHGLIFSSLTAVAAGYIINHFYDEERDELGKPILKYFKDFVSQQSYLYLYLLLNTVSLCVAFFLSWKIGVFFIIYQFLIWLYSHKISRWIFVKNIFKVILVLFPFLALIIHYQIINKKILLFASLLFLLLLIKEILKDVKNYISDSIFKYQSIPNTFGLQKTGIFLAIIQGISLLISLYLSNYQQIGDMIWYFRVSNLLFIFGIAISFFPKRFLWIALGWMYKIWIFLGVLAIVLIDWKDLPLQR